MNRRFPIVFPITLLVLGCASAEDPQTAEEPSAFGPGHALVSLVSETAVLIPGETAMIGVTFDIEPGWYLYWNGRSDTGLPITVTPVLPEGYEAGEILWPAPQRHVSPGDILDHIYTEEVTLLLPVTVPADAPVTESASIGCRLEWVACSDVCVPGRGSAAITLPLVAGDDQSQNQAVRAAAARSVSSKTHEQFARARARIPQPLPAAGGSGVTWEWSDGSLVVSSKTGGRMFFYPATDSAPLVSALTDAASETGTLTLRLAEDIDGFTSVAGVLEVAGETPADFRIYHVDFPLEFTRKGSNS